MITGVPFGGKIKKTTTIPYNGALLPKTLNITSLQKKTLCLITELKI